MNIHEFKAKWQSAHLKESAASHEHFLDLCRVLNKPTPAEADRDGVFYTFERGVAKTGGGKGFADVWYKDRFAWEYKGLHADLDAAYKQLLLYHEDLDNPPLLVVCDLDRFEIHTKFTGRPTAVYQFDLDSIDDPEHIRILNALWENPNALRPGISVEKVTEDAAERFGQIALELADQGINPERTAHFLVQLLFCLFAEDIGLLPSEHFSKLLRLCAERPELFPSQIEGLFVAMRDGGVAGYESIDRFNGGLFETIEIVELSAAQLRELLDASKMDWASIEPAIIGTLFERSLDPARRSQLGAHYTGRRDIERVIDPVMMTPLLRRWDEVRVEADKMKAVWENEPTEQRRRNRRNDYAQIIQGFQTELTQVRVLDPACGSGNFLYVALEKLLALEKEVIIYGAANGLPLMFPQVRPSQLYGLEINQYAQELTQVVIWIGYLQWMNANGFQPRRDPVLGDMDNIRLQDALIDRSDPDNPKEAEWPTADYIIGNPPFLGGKRLRSELGDEYIEDLFDVFDDRLGDESDLCCYFFEKARDQLMNGETRRAGLLATNSIRGGVNRVVLQRIKQTGDIFMAWSDEQWVLDGAAVRISIIGFDDGSDSIRALNGDLVAAINPDLTDLVDITVSERLAKNSNVSFMGDTKNGKFDIKRDLALQWLELPPNPNSRLNSDVVHPWMNGMDVTRRSRDMWIVDFGTDMPEVEAALYEAPFEYVREHVYPARQKNRNPRVRERWWIHEAARPKMRDALEGLERFVATPTVAKYRLFVWLGKEVIPDHQLIVFARDDDYFFGVLHSRAHEVWSLRMGTWLGKGNDPRYTPTTTFETFPRLTDGQREAIGEAAKRLDELRNNWLNPPDATEAELKKRTLTNLYNQRPTWLDQAHYRLDQAVWAAYGWEEDPKETDDETILQSLLALNLERAAEEQKQLV